MIQKVIYFLIVYLMITPTLVTNGHLPNAARWLTEVISIGFIPVILIYLAITKKFYASLQYLVLIFLTFFIVAVSFLYNQSSASALILGLRHHFTYLPFFLLPMTYNFSEKDIKKILCLICAFLIIQTPISFMQRFVWFSHLSTGDVVRGTLGGSGTMSVILVSGISVLYSMFLTKQVSLRTFLVIAVFLLFPTLINETKATFIMLPIAIAISTILFDDQNILLKLKKVATYFLITTMFAFIFLNVYDVIYGHRHSRVTDHFQKEVQGEGYIYYGEDRAMERMEAGYDIGRLDSVMFAIKNISKDPGNFFFGIGIGNAISTKVSFLKTENNDLRKFEPDKTTITNVLWELGVSGLLIQLAFLVFLFKDALAMRGGNNFINAFCLGWCGVIGIRLITLFYHNVLHNNTYDILFWLLSGMVVSKSYQLKMSFSNPNVDIFGTDSSEWNSYCKESKHRNHQYLEVGSITARN